ncbi:hypothetical protein MAPG_09054 [Magnaporthiopsis poae ATCC 64411]|uniref:NAD dependent epimerase/dehydratase n=1 Tax=Magnaporthiopsis poae (strain ATCC 64411 / 73-15) TaxID=644358 RepID=A0A0C4E8Y2_MAGP6|nr:hypothetical protein MAPG_09054 [Magnaporthiopsis poae ATCC 64411]
MGQSPSKPVPGTKFRVIGAGMSRTGTKTLNEALEILLDGPVHDSGIQCFCGTRQQQHAWLEIMELTPKAKTVADQKRIDYLLAGLLEGYSSTMDTPANMMAAEILRVFPDAIVICTTRDAVPWAVSMYKMAVMATPWYAPLLTAVIPGVWHHSRWYRLHQKLIAYRLGYDDCRIEGIRDHEDRLRRVIPPEKLFFYRVSEGWGPLCEILGVPVPDRPFPHNNNVDDARAVIRGIVFTGSLVWLGIITVASGLGWLAYNHVRLSRFG